MKKARLIHRNIPRLKVGDVNGTLPPPIRRQGGLMLAR